MVFHSTADDQIGVLLLRVRTIRRQVFRDLQAYMAIGAPLCGAFLFSGHVIGNPSGDWLHGVQ